MHNPRPEVHPIELELGEWDGDKGASDGHQLDAGLGSTHWRAEQSTGATQEHGRSSGRGDRS